jgi:hypothetical protein
LIRLAACPALKAVAWRNQKLAFINCLFSNVRSHFKAALGVIKKTGYLFYPIQA